MASCISCSQPADSDCIMRSACSTSCAAHRIFGGVNRSEQIPVGLAGVDQDPDAVVGETAEGEPDSLDPLDEVVHGLGGPVAHLGPVPGHHLVAPPEQGPAKGLDLRRALVVLQVGAELVNGIPGQSGPGIRLGPGGVGPHLSELPARSQRRRLPATWGICVP